MLFSLFSLLGILTTGILASRFGSEFLIRSANRFLKTIDGPEIRAELQLDFLNFGLRIKHPFVRFRQGGTFDAEEIFIALQPIQLFYNHLIVRDLTIRKPRIVLEKSFLSGFGNDASKSTASSFDLPSLIALKKVQILDGEIELRLESDRESFLEDINFSSRYKDGVYHIALETGKGRIETKELRLPINTLSVKAGYIDNFLDIQDVVFFSPDIELNLKGNIRKRVEGEGELRFSLVLPLEQLSRIAPMLPKMKGTANLTAAIGGSISKPEVSGNLDIKDGWVNQQRVENAELTFRVNKEGAWLSGSKLHFAEGLISIERAEVLFQDSYPIDVSVRLENVELGHILTNVSDLHSKTFQYHTGPARMSGTLAPFRMDGRTKLNVRDHQTHSVGYTIRKPDTLVVGVPQGIADLGLRVDKDHFAIHSGTVYIRDTVIKVPIVYFGFDEVFHMEYTSEHLRFEDISPLVGLDMKGLARLSVAIDIDQGETDLKAWLEAKDYVIEGLALGDMRTDILLKNNELRFANASFRKGASTYHTNIRFDFNKTPTFMAIDMATDGLAVRDLIRILGLEDKLEGVLAGRLVGSGTFYGPFGHFDGSARFVLPEFTSSRQTFEKGRIEASLENNRVTIDLAEAGLGDSRVWVDGTVTNWKDLDLRIHSTDFPLNRLDLLSFLFEKAEGNFRLDGRIQGKLDDAVLQAGMYWDRLLVDGQTLPPSELHLELTRRYANLNGHFFDDSLQAEVDFRFTGPGNVSAKARFERFPFRFVTRRLLSLDLENGVFTGEASMKAPLNAIEAASGEASIQALSAKLSGMTLETQEPTQVVYANRLFRLDPVKVKGKKLAFETRGDVDLDGTLNAIFEGRTNLEFLALYSEEIQDGQGPVDFDLTLSGNWDKFAIAGETSFRQGMLTLKSLESPLENLKGTLRFDANRINLSDISLNYGGGAVKLSGWLNVALPRMEILDNAIRLELNRVAIGIREDMIPIFSGWLAVSGNRFPLTIDGSLSVDEMAYTKNIRWQKTLLLDQLINVVRPKKHLETEGDPPKLRFNVSVEAEDTIRIQNNLAELNLTADLQLVGDNKNPGLLNTLSTDKGKIFFQNNDFEIVRLMVEFVDPTRIHPTFDLLAETHVRYIEEEEEKNVLISMEIKGNLDKPTVLLSSDAGLSHTDIVSLLLIGQPASRLNQEGSMVTGLNALSDISGVNDQIRSQFKLDEFRLTSEYSQTTATGGTNIVPKLVVGKRIAEKVYLTYSTSLGEQQTQGEQEFEIKYRMKNFTVSGQWDNNSLAPQGNLGVDLKFHFDF